LELEVRVNAFDNDMFVLSLPHDQQAMRVWWQFFNNFFILFLFIFISGSHFITLYQGISWAKKYHGHEETLKKCRQLQEVQTHTGSKLLEQTEDQKAVKTAQQSAHKHKGGVAGGGNSFSLSVELSAVLHRDLPCGNEVPKNKLYLKKQWNRFTIIFTGFIQKILSKLTNFSQTFAACIWATLRRSAFSTWHFCNCCKILTGAPKEFMFVLYNNVVIKVIKSNMLMLLCIWSVC